MSKGSAAPAAELEADRRDYRDRSPKVVLMTQHDMLRDLVPTPRLELSAEEEGIRARELEEETLLQAALEVARAATAKAASDLAALRKRSREAGGKTFMSSIGLDSTPVDEEAQRKCRALLPFAENALNEAREAEEAAYREYRTACNKHGQRRTRALQIQSIRSEDPGRAGEIRAARAQRLQDFLSAPATVARDTNSTPSFV